MKTKPQIKGKQPGGATILTGIVIMDPLIFKKGHSKFLIDFQWDFNLSDEYTCRFKVSGRLDMKNGKS